MELTDCRQFVAPAVENVSLIEHLINGGGSNLVSGGSILMSPVSI